MPPVARSAMPVGMREDQAVSLDPMLPYLVQLENAYDPKRSLEYDPYELVRFALTMSGYWADKALDWLSSGLPATPVASELRLAADDKRLPQRVRHRAFGLWKQSGQV
jgi:hypothetical protein